VSMKLFDITMPYKNGGAHWPGDASYTYTQVADINKGSSVNVGMISLGVHGGTHIDAPFHYLPDGKTIEKLPIESFVIPVAVVDAIGASTLDASLTQNIDFDKIKGVLFKTCAWKDRNEFPMDIPTVSPALALFLKSKGITLIGVDVPSVDAIEDSTIKAHKAIGECGLNILEGLMLDDIPIGYYELIALPILIEGSDASPVRAVLKQID